MNGTGVPLLENWRSVIKQIKFRYRSVAIRPGRCFVDIGVSLSISLVQRGCYVHHVPIAASARVEHEQIAKILEQLDSVSHSLLRRAKPVYKVVVRRPRAACPCASGPHVNVIEYHPRQPACECRRFDRRISHDAIVDVEFELRKASCVSQRQAASKLKFVSGCRRRRWDTSPRKLWRTVICVTVPLFAKLLIRNVYGISPLSTTSSFADKVLRRCASGHCA